MSPAPTSPPRSARIRLAAADDAPAILAVYAPYVETPVTFDAAAPTPEEFAARMADVMPFYPCLVLEQAGRIAGFAYAHAQAARAAYRWNAELSVYLEPGACGAGRGRALYGALLELLELQGILSAYALVTVPNEASERLHEALRFERSWTQRNAGWKRGAWHDVAWYAKALASFDERPAEPVPFDVHATAHPVSVQRVLEQANAALAEHGARRR